MGESSLLHLTNDPCLFLGCLLHVSAEFTFCAHLPSWRPWPPPLCFYLGKILTADLALLRTLLFPLGSLNSGPLVIPGKSCSSQRIVIRYSPYFGHRRWSCFLSFHWKLFSSIFCCWLITIWGKGKYLFEDRKNLLTLRRGCNLMSMTGFSILLRSKLVLRKAVRLVGK